MALKPHCIFQRGTGPIVAAAIHNGHQTRKSVEQRLAIDEKQQLREEDPITGEWTQIAKTQIVGLRSRFEVDLNRPRDKAVYETPADAWGLEVWDTPPDQSLIDASLREYDLFYAEVKELLEEMLEEYPRVVVYDLHTYNQRRQGPDGPVANPATNPEVNIGTGTMDRQFWSPVVERLMRELRSYDFHGRQLDVRENVKFQGGYFCEWIHKTFPQQVCAIAIEFKKFFMDEWEGEPDPDQVECIYQALEATIPGVREALEKM
ncbi:N-formylglutamate amidohydrolase [Aporhodopirellula aestuarii]|uniref:N-formylglutamate amidohydrolase n=1 Tax=Aporhodopirellula aestuarii TaxID=2950107 RepID=A0ABT0U9K2_9BACT|nr:N-formylglutamate amidohydrolase [Aporhodopirellula aestuarii]MCM2373654.1 N-formylglutamate amidohydrolase [Aporhodopirellula aestuarii]